MTEPARATRKPRSPKGRARLANERLKLEYSDAVCELDHRNAFELLAATILSAQSTDARVNMVTPALFARYPTPEDLAAKGIHVLPQTLHEAVAALEDDPLFAEQLGEAFVGEFVRLKRMEWVEYQRHVSDWEVARYLEFF